MKNWAAFDRGASLWALSKRDGVYSIVGYRRRRDSGREPDPNQRVTLPPEASVEELIERTIAILQAAAAS